MDLAEFHYDLPPELIATHPAERRDLSRLMLVRRDGSPFEHRRFMELPGLLRPGDCLVLNDSKVLPARLHLRRPGGGLTELLLLAPLGQGVWEAMVRPARKLHAGMRLELPGGAGEAEVIESEEDKRVAHDPGRLTIKDEKCSGVPPLGGFPAEPGTPEPRLKAEHPNSIFLGEPEGASDRIRRIRFPLNLEMPTFLERHGEMPLPPYILHERKARGEPASATPEDRVRYQTIYASPAGSIAAPTAGLHFTPDVLDKIQARGIEVRRVTLHVGIGTFEPVAAGRVESHVLHREHYSIGEEDAAAIEAARLDTGRRDSGRRIVAVGTTTVRALESCLARHGRIQAASEETNIFIYPGFKFGLVQAILTNFHLPGSTLILLVAAFAGRDRILAAYQEAIARQYRFYSYGDAMLIE